MSTANRILVVDDEASVADALNLVLGERGHKVKSAQSVGEADALLKSYPFDLVFTDLRLPDGSGIDLLTRIKADSPETEIILMTAHGSLELTIEAIKRGAFYYLEKPFTPDQALVLAAQADS
jgi:DNA-binding NtrC family response regulator